MGLCIRQSYSDTFNEWTLNPLMDPLLLLLSRASHLECLGLVGQDDQEAVFGTDIISPAAESFVAPSLSIPRLHHLSIVDLFKSAAIKALSKASMPSMRSLTVTRFDFLPPNATNLPELMVSLKGHLQSLHFVTPHSTINPQIIDTTFHDFPSLTYLTLSSTCSWLAPLVPHPLQCLAIPKPVSRLLPELERMLPLLPSLRVIRFWDVRWLPGTINARARASGTSGEMATWKRRLNSRGVAVVDADGRES